MVTCIKLYMKKLSLPFQTLVPRGNHLSFF